MFRMKTLRIGFVSNAYMKNAKDVFVYIRYVILIG